MFDSIPVRDERARTLAAAVHELDRAYRVTRAALLEDLDVSDAELAALTAIGREDGMTAKHIAREVGLTTSATTSLLDRLTASGLLQRRPNPADRRSVVVVLTAYGSRMMAAAYQRYVGRFEELLTARPCAGECVDDVVASMRMLTDALLHADEPVPLTA